MKLFNTQTRSVDEITPLAAPKITVYTCGPTVYDYAHIGHWFNYVRMDTLIRTLTLSGYQPEWVMNITDVGHLVSDADEGEDKLEKGAQREGKTAWEVAEFYTADFMECLKLLRISSPAHIPKATEHVGEQIELIQKLEAKGYTYVIDDGVYYDTSKFEGYAAFARLDLDDLQAGARVEYNAQKRQPTDFALWKFSPQDQQRDMEWDSPWGKGFPGWHIECSAMAMKYLGETLDIHTGGIDHVPIHHTNEIAQSEAATGKRFANHWLHSNHVTVNGEKISKSLGNGIRLQEIIERGIVPEAVRLHVLESHYRSQSRFSWESLEAAANRLKAYQAMADRRWQVSERGNVQAAAIEAAKQQILDSLQDDLGTPRALLFLSQLDGAIDSGGLHTAAQSAFTDFLGWLDEAFALGLARRSDISDEQKAILKDRQAARDTKDWVTSDDLRKKLLAQGISVKDRADGATSWAREA